jgi:RIO kinase 1
VYHALTPDRRHLALKIYKTSILVFKDRDKYVTGEHRFRNGYSRHNPRKMVKMWAEKEMRNLKRLSNAGIYAPEVYEVRENVLVISFLGDNEGWFVHGYLYHCVLTLDSLQGITSSQGCRYPRNRCPEPVS